MSTFPCDQEIECDDIISGEECDSQGVTGAYYIGKNQIDKAAMTAAYATYFNEAECIFTGFAYTGTKRFKRLSFDIEGSLYRSEKPSGSQLYDHVITSLFKGKSPKQTQAILKMAAQCGGLIVVVFTENCQARVFGIEFNAKACRFDCYKMAEDNHVDTHGQFNSDGVASDTFNIIGKSRCPAGWISGDEKAFIQANVA